MSEIEFKGKKIATDDAGFIQDSNEWTPELAEYIAKKSGISELTTDHWKVINNIRSHYLKVGTAPLIRTLLKETGFNLRQIYLLFPEGPAKGACKIAGLSKPTGCV